ncbi:MAG TPA: cysteine--tRNA ligase [Candidatus Eremiobacteraceae bacterium]|nr:cysteine--tRNA ligase [Candidatus Eremiobacteraceae bacterium]
MALQLYNTRTRALEPFAPLDAANVRVYVCGMTPSFHPHLGHARTFITFDVLVRYLRAKGYPVTYVRNVTDIDDRIIDRANADGLPWDEVVSRYYGEFEECARLLGMLEPDLSPRATREMPCIIELIERLVALTVAYETGDGVYFSVEKFPNYGRLSRRNIDELRAGERVAVREEKRDPLDFALWKKAKPGEPTWESPWGPGRPGWHIECSAMCHHYFGDQFDIHGGAMDLVFPHHENEVAQTESATGKAPMACFWVHAGLLQVDNQKMSKSLGNFIPLKDFLASHPPAAIRYLFFQTGYRKPSNFTPAALDAAAKGLRGLYEDLAKLRSQAEPSEASPPAIVAPEFDAFMDDDLNTSGALGWLQRFVREQRDGAPDGTKARQAIAVVERCLGVLGLPASAEAAGFASAPARGLNDRQRGELVAIAGDGSGDDAALVDRVIALRNEARAKKDFAASDRLRDALAKAGVSVRDSKAGTEWSFDGGA